MMPYNIKFVVRRVVDVVPSEIDTDGTYSKYFPFGFLTEASLMRRYDNKFQFLIRRL